MSDDDRDLRERFARLRDEERAHAPAFHVTRQAPRWTWSPRVVIAAAIVLIALVLARPDQAPRRFAHPGIDLGVVAWQSPTDFLLVTPGRELMRTVPDFGSPEPLVPIDLHGRPSAPESTRS